MDINIRNGHRLNVQRRKLNDLLKGGFNLNPGLIGSLNRQLCSQLCSDAEYLLMSKKLPFTSFMDQTLVFKSYENYPPTNSKSL